MSDQPIPWESQFFKAQNEIAALRKENAELKAHKPTGNPTELKQRIAESLSAPFQFSHEGISTVKDLLRACLSHIEEQEKRIDNLNSHFSQVLSEAKSEKTAREVAESQRESLRNRVEQLQSKLAALEKRNAEAENLLALYRDHAWHSDEYSWEHVMPEVQSRTDKFLGRNKE